jgi:hypothetical protein
LRLEGPASVASLPWPAVLPDRRDPDWQVDKEHETPAELGSAQGDEEPADDGTERRRYGESKTEAAERTPALRAGKGILDVSGDLRAEHAAEESLNHPGHDDENRIGREAHRRTCDDKTDETDNEDTTTATDVPESAADDRHQSESEHVTGDDPLQLRRARPGGEADRRKSNIRDAHIKKRGELAEEQNPEPPPPTGIGRLLADTRPFIRH